MNQLDTKNVGQLTLLTVIRDSSKIEAENVLLKEQLQAILLLRANLLTALNEITALKAQLAECKKDSFQERVRPWMIECFGLTISCDRVERNHRFLEESLELVQSLGCTQTEAHQLVDYVYGRPDGEPYQEVGGVMVTLAALCLANQLDMSANGETELARIWAKVEQIRAKQAAKPKYSPLPQG